MPCFKFKLSRMSERSSSIFWKVCGGGGGWQKGLWYKMKSFDLIQYDPIYFLKSLRWWWWWWAVGTIDSTLVLPLGLAWTWTRAWQLMVPIIERCSSLKDYFTQKILFRPKQNLLKSRENTIFSGFSLKTSLHFFGLMLHAIPVCHFEGYTIV